MTLLKQIVAELTFWEDCRKYGVGLWQCPRFLFVVMGVITIVAMVATHFLTVNYAEPELVVVSVVSVAVIIFTVGHIVVGSFDKMASANRMKTEFVSIVSHQLRSPLSSLKWSLGFLLSGRIGKMEGKSLEQLELLKRSTDRMIELVNDLLNVTRIDEGRIVLRKEKIILADLVNDLVSQVESFARANNARVEVENTLGDTSVYGDRQYLTIVLENFVTNAVRYLNSGAEGKVKIFLKKRGRFARVEVEDNGVGIPRSEQKNIFQKFFRAQNALRHRTEGSGLGLYVSKAFVELHEGKVGFSSQEGKGSTFWFELPLA